MTGHVWRKAMLDALIRLLATLTRQQYVEMKAVCTLMNVKSVVERVL
jgi:hypothetical protein